MSQSMTAVRAGENAVGIQARFQLEREFFPNGLTPDMIRLFDRFEQVVEQISSMSFKSGYKLGGMIQADEWSNNACLGYAILGAKRLEGSDEQINRFVHAIRSEFNFISVEEAAGVYERSPY